MGCKTSSLSGGVLFMVRPLGISAIAEAVAPPQGRNAGSGRSAVNNSR